jgi:hypothetical protein
MIYPTIPRLSALKAAVFLRLISLVLDASGDASADLKPFESRSTRGAKVSGIRNSSIQAVRRSCRCHCWIGLGCIKSGFPHLASFILDWKN